ncbi:MAG: DUF6120 family protein [Sellimonas sp.]|uniref:DUF6120 family protein n=1 Tax=Sellimonas sp. TaxID=2021466 RepID=UPI0039A2FEDA
MGTIVKDYVLSVKKQINFSDKSTKSFLNILENNVANFVQEHPLSTYEQIEEIFGSPSEVAESYLSTLDTNNIKSKLKLKKKILTYLVIIFSLLALFVCGVYFWHCYNISKEIPAYSVEEIEEIERSE